MTADEVRSALKAMGATHGQADELAAEPERAAGWIEWALQHSSHIGTLLNEFRTGDAAPDLTAIANRPKGPNADKLRRACEALTRNTGHEYLAEDLEAEFDRLAAEPKIGNGATLPAGIRTHLLQQAAEMRKKHAAGQQERDELDHAHTSNYYRTRWHKWTPAQRAKVRERLPGLTA